MTLNIKNYIKPNDLVTLVFNKQTKAIQSIRVASYLDDPTGCCDDRGSVRQATRWHEPRDRHADQRRRQALGGCDSKFQLSANLGRPLV